MSEPDHIVLLHEGGDARQVRLWNLMRFPESESALLADMTAENAHADLLADPKGRELGP